MRSYWSLAGNGQKFNKHWQGGKSDAVQYITVSPSDIFSEYNYTQGVKYNGDIYLFPPSWLVSDKMNNDGMINLNDFEVTTQYRSFYNLSSSYDPLDSGVIFQIYDLGLFNPITAIDEDNFINVSDDHKFTFYYDDLEGEKHIDYTWGGTAAKTYANLAMVVYHGYAFTWDWKRYSGAEDWPVWVDLEHEYTERSDLSFGSSSAPSSTFFDTMNKNIIFPYLKTDFLMPKGAEFIFTNVSPSGRNYYGIGTAQTSTYFYEISDYYAKGYVGSGIIQNSLVLMDGVIPYTHGSATTRGYILSGFEWPGLSGSNSSQGYSSFHLPDSFTAISSSRGEYLGGSWGNMRSGIGYYNKDYAYFLMVPYQVKLYKNHSLNERGPIS